MIDLGLCTIALLAMLAASCAKPDTAPSTGSGSAATAGSANPTHVRGSGSVDLIVKPSFSTRASIAAGKPFTQELDVWSPSTVSITVTQASGALGPFTLDLYEVRAPKPLLISSDSMTCAEPACAMRAEVDIAPDAPRIRAQVRADVALDVTVDVVAKTKP